MTKTKSKNIIEKLKHYYGKVDVALSHNNIYELTIAVVLSAQTTDRQVNLITPELFKKYSEFEKLSNASVGEVESIIRSVGLYKTKSRNIIKLSEKICNDYNNNVPDKIEELIKLPGIGRKSANVILSIGFKTPAFAVDTHVLRIANRLGYVKSSDPLKAEIGLTRYIPRQDWIEAHLLLINHGRALCNARNPKCPDCPVMKLCDEVNRTRALS